MLDIRPDVREQDVPAVSMDGCTLSVIISDSDVQMQTAPSLTCNIP